MLSTGKNSNCGTDQEKTFLMMIREEIVDTKQLSNDIRFMYLCEKWAEQRRALEEFVGHQRLDNFEGTMLQGQQEWTTWTRYTEIVLRLKKTDMESDHV